MTIFPEFRIIRMECTIYGGLGRKISSSSSLNIYHPDEHASSSSYHPDNHPLSALYSNPQWNSIMKSSGKHSSLGALNLQLIIRPFFIMDHHCTILFLIFYINATIAVQYDNDTTIAPVSLPVLLENEEIRRVWPREFIEACTQADQYARPASGQCFVRLLGLDPIRVEVINRRPAILRLHRFIADPSQLARIAHAVRTSRDVESQGVEGAESNGGRRADGLWLLHHEPEVRELYARMQRVLTLNPAIAEDFLVLRYGPYGHYAPHYDHLDPMPPEYDDGWFAYFGNRMATALLLVEGARRGGTTVFPRLGLNIRPGEGDLLLWLNADSNDQREENALHAACPIIGGEKVAVSLWVRGNFQNSLRCSRHSAAYEPEDLIRRHIPKSPIRPLWRPAIPQWVFDQ